MISLLFNTLFSSAIRVRRWRRLRASATSLRAGVIHSPVEFKKGWIDPVSRFGVQDPRGTVTVKRYFTEAAHLSPNLLKIQSVSHLPSLPPQLHPPPQHLT